MRRLCGGTRGKAPFRNAAKRSAARRNKTKLLEWIKTYRDTVAPLLLSTITLPLEAALHAVEFANSSVPLGQTDWGALARCAHDWWTGQKGGLVSPHILGAPDPIMSQVETRHWEAWAAAGHRQKSECGGMATRRRRWRRRRRQ